LDPLCSFHEQIVEDKDSYERLKRGEVFELMNLYGLGRLLVGPRIARGLTQRELADRVGVLDWSAHLDNRSSVSLQSNPPQ
jgi:hypothetical protein